MKQRQFIIVDNQPNRHSFLRFRVLTLIKTFPTCLKISAYLRPLGPDFSVNVLSKYLNSLFKLDKLVQGIC